MERLDAVEEGGAVLLAEEVWTDQDSVIGADAEEVTVEGCVMEVAEGEAVRTVWTPSSS